MKKYQKLLGEMKAVEGEKRRLAEQLAADEAERRDLQQARKDATLVVKNYEKLLDKVKDLEGEKKKLEERLAASEAQQKELQRKLASMENRADMDSAEMSTLKDLHSTVARLLKVSGVAKAD